MSVETEYWLEIQKQRQCKGCLFFDPSREGKDRFCTYAWRLNIEQTEQGEICHTRKGMKFVKD